jgi:hypothetical protein
MVEEERVLCFGRSERAWQQTKKKASIEDLFGCPRQARVPHVARALSLSLSIMLLKLLLILLTIKLRRVLVFQRFELLRGS